MSDPKKVLILGGGPGALFAFHGAMAAGYRWEDVQIWAKELTYPRGAFWLHEVPEALKGEFQPEPMGTYLIGTAEGYSRKQWGEVFPTSVEEYADKVFQVYNPAKVLPRMWELANKQLVDIKWTMERVVLLARSCENVIVTFPIVPEAVAAMTGAGSRIPVYSAPTLDENGINSCTYVGSPTIAAVRITRAFGYLSIEYPLGYAGDAEALCKTENSTYGLQGQVGFVPELHPMTRSIFQRVWGPKGNILITGRWATLDRKALSHQSYHDTYSFLTWDK